MTTSNPKLCPDCGGTGMVDWDDSHGEPRNAVCTHPRTLEQRLLEAIDRLHPGTDCDNLRLMECIVALVNASRAAHETTAAPAPKGPFMYSTSYCEKHKNMPWSMTVRATTIPPRVVCPLCEPPVNGDEQR